MNYPRKLRTLLCAVRAEGLDFALPSGLRAALVELGSTADAGRRSGAAADGEIPAALARYADTVARHAYRVTDADVTELRTLGFSEEAIFEATIATAVGAGCARMEAVLRAVAAVATPVAKEGT